MTDYVDLLDVLTEGRELPEGYDCWAIKSTRPDLSTRNDFRWPFPGNATQRFELLDHNNECPRQPGDGVCVAKTWCGMASGGFPARTLLLIAYLSSEARGGPEKLRVPQAFVVDLIDGERLLLTSGTRANLIRANLAGANLAGADLAGSRLAGAYLARAYLEGANLEGANLKGAYLKGAYLEDAYLAGADLIGADLAGAYLEGANLKGANLVGAYLEGANLKGANLAGANLAGANLAGANLKGAIR
jgi:hypothetical protein